MPFAYLVENELHEILSRLVKRGLGSLDFFLFTSGIIARRLVVTLVIGVGVVRTLNVCVLA